MLAPQLLPSALGGSAPVILQFPTEAFRPVRSLRHMTTQLLQEAAQVIPNQQLLINVVSKRVRQLGLGHRPMVEVSPRASLTDIALQEIIAGKLTYESLEGSLKPILVMLLPGSKMVKLSYTTPTSSRTKKRATKFQPPNESANCCYIDRRSTSSTARRRWRDALSWS